MDILKKIIDYKEQNINFCVATIVRAEGSTPGKVGFKYLTKENRESIGTIGGGEIETVVCDESLRRIKSGQSGLKEYILTDSDNFTSTEAEVVPMMCSGKLWIFFEVFNSMKSIYVFGGGHVGKELGYFLKPLKYKVICIDNRKDIANTSMNPFFDEVIFADYEEYSKSFNPPDNSYFVVLTHGHSFDYVVVKNLLERNIQTKYIGVIASSVKATKLKSMLKEELGENVNLSYIQSPIGLNIGGESASEIALSIAAQIQSFVFGKN